MSPVSAVFFDCDGTLVDSEMLCSQAYAHMFAVAGISITASELFKRFKGVNFHDILRIVAAERGKILTAAQYEPVFRGEVARLFDLELQPVDGAAWLLERICVPVCVVSNGPKNKIQHALIKTGLAHHFADHLYSAHDIQHWKPDPALMHHAASALSVDVTDCLLVEDSLAGVQAGIAAAMRVYYLNNNDDSELSSVSHPAVTSFHQLSQLPAIWQAQGITICSA